MGSMIDERAIKINKQREAILRFYCAMTGKDYEYVVQEYLGQAPPDSWTNKLYMNVEATIHFMNFDNPAKSTTTKKEETE